MNEKEFTKKLQKSLQKELRDCEVKMDENLIYKVIIDEELQYVPANPKEPKRGELAFQIDLLIKKNSLPLVAIETKLGSFTTHDVLTYSTKALKHKEVYPYLRYGFVVGNVSVIANKFFIHNSGFDFALAIKDVKNLEPFINLVQKQICNSEKFLEILKKKNKTKLFSLNLELKMSNLGAERAARRHS